MFKKVASAVVLASVLVILPACLPWGTKEVSQAAKQSLYVINVLDNDLFNDCHITGSVNVTLDQIENFAKNLDKNAEIVVYCSGYTCLASSQVAQQLKNLGFKHVWAYEAGMADWHQKGQQAAGKYPVEGACTKSYLASANEEIAHEGESSVAFIGTDELREKMIVHGLIPAQ